MNNFSIKLKQKEKNDIDIQLYASEEKYKQLYDSIVKEFCEDLYEYDGVLPLKSSWKNVNFFTLTTRENFAYYFNTKIMPFRTFVLSITKHDSRQYIRAWHNNILNVINANKKAIKRLFKQMNKEGINVELYSQIISIPESSNIEQDILKFHKNRFKVKECNYTSYDPFLIDSQVWNQVICYLPARFPEDNRSILYSYCKLNKTQCLVTYITLEDDINIDINLLNSILLLVYEYYQISYLM